MSSNKEAKAGQYLTLSLKGQVYGVPIGSIREINRVSEITAVPKTPDFVAGVMNLRGKVIPVVNLRLKFGLEFAEYTKDTCIVVIEGVQGYVGLIVDSVSAVIDLKDDQIEPRPVMGDEKQLRFVTGMGKTEEKVVILLDVVEALAGETLPEQIPEMAKAA